MNDKLKEFQEFTVFLGQIRKLQKKLYLYDELFCNDDSVELLNRIGQKVFSIIQKALNTEIIVELAALFDKKGDDKRPNLSQDYFVSKYGKTLDENERKLFERVHRLLTDLNIRNYRHKYLGHKDLRHYLGDDLTKHHIDTNKLIDLTDNSYYLIESIQVRNFKCDRTQNVYRPKKLTGSDSGLALIEKLRKLL